MPRHQADTCVTIVVDRDELADLRRVASGRGLSVAALFRVAMNEYIERRMAGIDRLDVRDTRGRPRKT